MSNTINPKEFGLHARTTLVQVDEHTVALVIDRKSRIIMADGRKIMEKVAKIRLAQPELNIILQTSAPVCSKTSSFLQEAGIVIQPL